MERLLSGSPSRKNEVILSNDASLIPEGDAWTAAVDPDLAGSQWRRYLVRLDILVAEGTIYQVQNRQDLFGSRTATLGSFSFTAILVSNCRKRVRP
jgi:hypothetical protein